MAENTMRSEGDAVQVDPAGNTDDIDSSYGDEGFSSYSASLRSSVLEYRYEHGRRYHSRDATWFAPNDEDEQQRMDILHHMWKLICNGELVKFKDRITDWSRVLDVGTGTGIWAIDVADEHPESVVIGTDLSPIQPSWVPPNCFFYVEDAQEEWKFEHPFSLIHSRMMGGSFKDWQSYYQRCFDNLVPGGVIEAHEYDFHIYNQDGEEPPAVQEYTRSMIEATEKLGSSVDIGSKHSGWIKAAGFEDVEDLIITCPLGTWAKDKRLKEIGRFNMVQMVEGVANYAVGALTAIGRPVEEVHVLVAETKRELLDKKNKHYVNFRAVYGKKPKKAAEGDA